MFVMSRVVCSLLCFGILAGIPEFTNASGDVTDATEISVPDDSSLYYGDDAWVSGSTVLTLSGKGVLKEIRATDCTRVEILGGEVLDDDDNAITVMDQGVLQISDGTISTESASLVVLRGQAHGRIDGGTFGVHRSKGVAIIDLSDDSSLDLLGGNFHSDRFFQPFRITGNGILNVYGNGLRFEDRLLFGELFDGTQISGLVDLEGNGQIIIHNVPEVIHVAPLGLLALSFLCRIRREIARRN